MYWHIDCSTSTTSSFRIWNSSAAIPSPSLALLVVTLPKAPLTSYSGMSGSRWVTPSLWLSGSLRLFFVQFSMYSCYLFFISFASVRSFHFSPLSWPILTWNVPLISPIFLKRSLVFPIQLFFSISLYCSLKKGYLSLLFSGTLHSVGCILPFLPCFLLLFFPQLFVKPPQTTTLPSWVWSIEIEYYISLKTAKF